MAIRSGQGRSALWGAGLLRAGGTRLATTVANRRRNPAPVQGETLGRSKVQPWSNDVLPATHCIGLLSVAHRNYLASPGTSKI